MMRFALVISMAISVATVSPVAGQRYKPMPSMSEEEFDRLTTRLSENPPHLSPSRVPSGHKIGRCLFEVNGKRLISGNCLYSIGKDGEFQIDGPRQVYTGIDYPDPECFCQTISTDYVVQVDRELSDDGTTGPGWIAHWNGEERATHVQQNLGSVSPRGACYVNAETKICLWKR
jgi:hypothetical protein